jgi:uncharacterized protein
VLILLSGASGFLGTSLVRRLSSDGHSTRQLVRRQPTHPTEFSWDPYAGDLPMEALDGVDAVVNLSGAPIAHWPWTSSYRKTLMESRTATTRTIVGAITALDRPPPALINGSGVGYYGADRDDEELDETSTSGEGYLAEVVRQWESATQPAAEAGARVVLLRTSPVLDRSDGVLKVMTVPFRLGVGGRLGNGRQWFASISLQDWVSAAATAITNPTMSGPYNLVAPEPATNADLTRLLGKLLHRPTLMRVPAFALKAVAGELSDQVLGSLKARPRRLLDAGFTFAHPDLASELEAAFADDRSLG